MKKDCTGSTVRWPLCCMYGSFDDEPEDILKVSESRWQIEACFRIMKTDFSARPVLSSETTGSEHISWSVF